MIAEYSPSPFCSNNPFIEALWEYSCTYNLCSVKSLSVRL